MLAILTAVIGRLSVGPQPLVQIREPMPGDPVPVEYVTGPSDPVFYDQDSIGTDRRGTYDDYGNFYPHGIYVDMDTEYEMYLERGSMDGLDETAAYEAYVDNKVAGEYEMERMANPLAAMLEDEYYAAQHERMQPTSCSHDTGVWQWRGVAPKLVFANTHCLTPDDCNITITYTWEVN